MPAVIMAGGYGTRLKELTRDLPKPMVPVAGRPALEHVVNHLEQHGVKR
ncbi:NTP transferase domain-containing protein, partial [Candidatus Sumerlaeota bacterium]|nr:NTP transferase domain-containing protein [Candidatus Sumerlaeota bacterium]